MASTTKISGYLALFCLALFLFSCSGDEQSYTTTISNNCAITSASLGTLQRTVTTEDTSYVITVSGNAYPLHIDQLAQEIYNTDSLPEGTDVRKIVFSSLAADGLLFYRNDADRDTLYSDGDTIDFSEPRMFTCYSTDGTQSRTYKISVSVHNSQSESFTWTTLLDSCEAFRSVEKMKAFFVNKKLIVLAKKQEKNKALILSEAQEWIEAEVQGIAELDFDGIIASDKALFMVENGVLKTSEDGVLWSELNTNISLKRLLGAGLCEFYALGADGKMVVSSDGLSWSADRAIDDVELLPVENVSSLWSQMQFNSNFHYVLLCGKNKEGKAVVWKKIVDQSGANTEAWALFSDVEDEAYAFPCLQQTYVFPYDSKLLGVGLDGAEVSDFYISSDAARSWKKQEGDYNPPSSLSALQLGAVVDDENFIYLVLALEGRVLKGRLNRLSYANNQNVFTKAIR